jgi:hypothetical protein
MMDEEEDNRKHFNLKSIMKESKKKKKAAQDMKEKDFLVWMVQCHFVIMYILCNVFVEIIE